MKNTRKFNLRAFISVCLFVLLLILFITAVALQIIDALIDPEIYAAIILNPELGKSYFLARLSGIVKAFHVIGGFIFVGLSVIHIVKNWKALKSYFLKNNCVRTKRHITNGNCSYPLRG